MSNREVFKACAIYNRLGEIVGVADSDSEAQEKIAKLETNRPGYGPYSYSDYEMEYEFRF